MVISISGLFLCALLEMPFVQQRSVLLLLNFEITFATLWLVHLCCLKCLAEFAREFLDVDVVQYFPWFYYPIPTLCPVAVNMNGGRVGG